MVPTTNTRLACLQQRARVLARFSHHHQDTKASLGGAGIWTRGIALFTGESLFLAFRALALKYAGSPRRGRSRATDDWIALVADLSPDRHSGFRHARHIRHPHRGRPCIRRTRAATALFRPRPGRRSHPVSHGSNPSRRIRTIPGRTTARASSRPVPMIRDSCRRRSCGR